VPRLVQRTIRFEAIFVIVIASDDDGRIGFCAALVTDALAAGTYSERIRASGVSERFLYQLSARLQG
jgi:hypothetical protein